MRRELKPYRIGLLFSRNYGDLGVISIAEQSYTGPLSKVERHVSDRFNTFYRCSLEVWTGIWRSEDWNRLGRKIYLGVRTGIFFLSSIFDSLRTADVFPVAAFLAPKNNNKKIIKIFFGGRKATTGNTSAVRRLHFRWLLFSA